MPVHFKIVFDAADPHRVAAFWAEAMDYKLEDHSGFIAGLLAQGVIAEDLLTEVDGHRAWKTLAAIRNPDDPFDEASDAGRGMRILFQTVPESKTVKNRVHLDLHVGLDNIDAEVERLEGLGATRQSDRFVEGPSQWVVMQDPEGNEFCVHS
jgi:predicted enzyme related to lactoylglutathione lyase